MTFMYKAQRKLSSNKTVPYLQTKLSDCVNFESDLLEEISVVHDFDKRLKFDIIREALAHS